MQCSAEQRNSEQYKAVQSSAVQCIAVHLRKGKWCAVKTTLHNITHHCHFNNDKRHWRREQWQYINIPFRWSAVAGSAVICNRVRFSAVPSSAKKICTVQCKAVQFIAVQCSSGKESVVQWQTTLQYITLHCHFNYDKKHWRREQWQYINIPSLPRHYSLGKTAIRTTRLID